jgi:hypothetical protein
MPLKKAVGVEIEVYRSISSYLDPAVGSNVETSGKLYMKYHAPALPGSDVASTTQKREELS